MQAGRDKSQDPTEVTQGGDVDRSIRAGPFRVSTAGFAPRLSIPSHVHAWSCVSVLLAGRFNQRFAGRSYDCTAGAVMAKPAGERHADRWFDAWSHHLIIEIDPTRHEQLGPARPVAEQILCVADVGAELIAHQVQQELRVADALTPVSVEGLILQLFAQVQRRQSAKGAGMPGWLNVAREFLHDNYRASIQLTDVAQIAGVHPDHLSRIFSEAYRVTIGEYVRKLRVDAAATRLASSSASIAEIAQETGFSDQSHLTRIFKRLKGVTPGRYRAAHEPRPGPPDERTD